MGKKLSFEERQKSQNAVNQFRDRHGAEFKALVLEKEKGADRSKVFDKEKVYIQHGEYDDANMPFVVVRNINYDCAYVNIAYNNDCLTIYLKDKTIDIIPR